MAAAWDLPPDPGAPRRRKKKAAAKKAKKKAAKKKARRARTRTSERRRRRSPAIRRGLLGHVHEYWSAIRKAAARSVKAPPKDFLSAVPTQGILGTGYWGVVWRTADERFVLKASLDITEGPHVALARKHARKHPGLAYFHRLWKLPRVWTNEQGYTPVWVMLREETDVDSIWANGSPARGYKTIFDALESLPRCCACLYDEAVNVRLRGGSGVCDPTDRDQAHAAFNAILARIASAKKGKHVADLIGMLYDEHRILLGDVHFGNVGLRRHNLREFGVKRHRQLVVTDLGDLAQAPIPQGLYPSIPLLSNPMAMSKLAESIPTVPGL